MTMHRFEAKDMLFNIESDLPRAALSVRMLACFAAILRTEFGPAKASAAVTAIAEKLLVEGGHDPAPPIPKPAAAKRPNRLWLWGVKRSRSFWWLAGVCFSSSLDLVQVLIARVMP